MSASVWKLRHADEAAVQSLSRVAKLPPLIARLLVLRGQSEPKGAREFLDPRRDLLHDPALLPGASEAAERLARAVRDGRKIVIYGDYDVDGVCGTSILLECLKLAGARDVDYYIPHRVDEGYGLNAAALTRLREERGADLVVTVDCGVTAVVEADHARALGLELLITDHHTPGPQWPSADTVVHPRSPQSTYPFPDLCGAAVAFKVAWQLCKSFGDGQRASPHLRDFLVRAVNYVALASVADVVPLEGENRIFVKHGLAGIARVPSVGLRALLDVAKASNTRKLNTGTIGFKIAPRINAAGRMERAMMAVELLTTTDAARAGEIARILDECNARRQETERLIVREAHAQVDAGGGLGERGAIVVASRDWHPGVIGIVAGRLAESYHRPAIVLAIGEELAHGSGRSIPGFDLHAALTACSRLLRGYGGHTAAAGLKLAPTDIDAFTQEFDQHCREALTPELKERVVWVDDELPIAMLSPALVAQVEALEPYGMGNPKPIFLAQPVRIAGEVKGVGTDREHAQLRLVQGQASARAVAWNKAGELQKLDPSLEYAALFYPQINEWQDRREVQLELKELRPVSQLGGPRVVAPEHATR